MRPKRTLAPGLHAVEADTTQLRQIILNLVVNGSEAAATARIEELVERVRLVTLEKGRGRG